MPAEGMGSPTPIPIPIPDPGPMSIASSALAARLKGRGLRFLKRRRSSVLRTRMISVFFFLYFFSFLFLWRKSIRGVPSAAYYILLLLGRGNWSKRISDSNSICGANRSKSIASRSLITLNTQKQHKKKDNSPANKRSMNWNQ